MAAEVEMMSTPHTPHKVTHPDPLHADPAHAPGKQHLDLGHTRADSHTAAKQFQRKQQAARVISRAPRGQRGS
jgi:hypothetical protein